MSRWILVFVLAVLRLPEGFSNIRSKTEDLQDKSPWRLDLDAFWPAVEEFTAMHSHLATHDDDIETFLRAREGRHPDEGEAGDEGERLFHLLYTPSPTPPGFSSFLDLLQFAEELRGVINRLSEQDEDAEENTSPRQHLYPEKKEQGQRPVEFPLEDVEESKENGKISEQDDENRLVENGDSTKPETEGQKDAIKPTQKNTNWIENPEGSEDAGDPARRPRRCSGVHPTPEEDPAEPRTTDGKKHRKSHKPYFSTFTFSFPLFEFDVPFSNFKILPLTDPYALPEDE